MAVVSIGNDTSEGREQKDRELAGKPDRSEQERRPSKAIYQPCLRNVLHPGADKGYELSAGKKLEVPMLEST